MNSVKTTPHPAPLRPVWPRRSLAPLALALGLLFALVGCSQEPSGPDPLRVSLEEGRQLFESKQVLMFDIREPDEHATGVASGAQLLPMSQLQQRAQEIPNDPARPVLLICNTQNRSSQVVQTLRKAGWTHVRYVHGGMSSWARNGWPMVKPFATPKS